jgi:hypothetical protein
VYLYRFDGDEADAITLARCDNVNEDQSAAPDAETAMVQRDMAVPQGPDAEGWVVVGKDSLNKSSSWYFPDLWHSIRIRCACFGKTTQLLLPK